MRLHRLELEGFGPFRARQVVDFDAFAGDGLFLISGRTGAGKSSVLDGVCFALYGSVPRYDGGGTRRLRSDHSTPDEPSRVSLEFTVGGERPRRLRVTRTPEYDRPKRRGEGMTTEKPTALLEEERGGAWHGLAALPREVGTAVTEILGLTREQFLQVILLAQGRFAEFLLADSADRQKLLRSLFGSHAYLAYESALEDRRRASGGDIDRALHALEAALTEAERLAAGVDAGIESEAETEAESGAIGGVAGVGCVADASEPAPATAPAAAPGPRATNDARAAAVTDRLDALGRAALRAAYRAEVAADAQRTADEHLDAARTAATKARERHDAFAARDAAAERLAGLERRAESVEADRARAARAEAAETLRGVLARAAAARAEADRLAERRTDARDEWHVVSGTDDAATADAGPDEARADADPGDVTDGTGEQPAALRARAEAATRDLGAWRDAALRERALPGEERERDALARRVAAIDDEITARDADAEAAAATAETTATRIDEAEAAAPGGVDAARASAAASREAAATRLEAARRADALADAEREARAAAAAAGRALSDASGHLSDLYDARLAGAAGELALKLADGEPCAVCGAVEHPAPATPAHGERIDDAAIERAEADKAAAADADAAAAAALASARTALAAARAEAAGLGTADAESADDAAAAALAAATRAVRDRDALRAALDTARAAVDAARRGAEERRAARAEHETARALAAATAEASARAAAEARGAFASVAERVALTESVRAAAVALADALEAADRAAAAADAAEAERGAALKASVFSDADEVAAALLPDAERRRLADEVRAHDDAVVAARARLLDAELALEGGELPDLEAALALVAERQAAARAAGAAAATAAERARGLDAARSRAARDAAALSGRLEADGVVRRLADTVAGRAPNRRRMSLETFVLAAELEQIVAAANVRLDAMSAGRYALAHTDVPDARGAAGLGLDVFDAFTGRARPPRSLSGGERFLASLALALGLAQVVTDRAGGIRLDTLFVDEGFGSLDGETLESAMEILDGLRAGGRTVGVISHVEQMREQIPAQLRIEALPGGASMIRPATPATPAESLSPAGAGRPPR